MPRPRTQHGNNVPILRGEKHDISSKILHQAGFETAWQAATNIRALTIVPGPSLMRATSSQSGAHGLRCGYQEEEKAGINSSSNTMSFPGNGRHVKGFIEM